MAVRRSLAWMGAAQASAFILQFGASVIVARILTPYEMGVFAVAMAIVGTLGILQAFGMQSILIREQNLTPERVATVFSVNALISLTMAAGIVAMAMLGGAFLQDPGTRDVLLVLALSPLIEIVNFLPAANLEREGRFKVISIVNTIKSLVLAVGTVTFAVLGYKYMSIAYAQIMAQIVAVSVLCWVGRSYLKFSVGFREFRWAAKFGLSMLAVAGVTDLSRRLSEIVLAKFLGLPALGIYNRASALNSLLWDRIHIVVGRVLFVDFADHKRRGVSLRDRYLSSLEIITALLWPAFAGLAVLAGPFILTVYGAKWVPAAMPLALLAIASLIQVSISMTWEVFVASGELRTQMRIEFIRAGLALAMFVIGCTVSLTAAAAARVGDALVAIVLYRPHLQRMTDTTLGDFLPIYGRSGLLTALAILPSVALMTVHGYSAETPLAMALASMLAGIALWIGGLFALRHPLLKEGQQVLKRLTGGGRAA